MAVGYAPVACKGTCGNDGGPDKFANDIGGAEAGPIPGPIAPASCLKIASQRVGDDYFQQELTVPDLWHDEWLRSVRRN